MHIKGSYYCPFRYAVFAWSVYERDNILSLFFMRPRGEKTETGYAERDNIMSLSVKEKRIKGTILLPLSRNMYVKGTLYCPSYYAVFKRIVHEGDNILSLSGK